MGLKVWGQVSDVAFDRQAALLRAERTFYQDDIDRQKALLATASAASDAVDALADIRERIRSKLETSNPEERRQVLQALETHVGVSRGEVEVSIGVPKQLVDSVQQTNVLRLASST